MDLESEEMLKEVLKEQKRLLVLHFWTTWSEPSRHINEALTDLSQTYSQHRFIKIEAEEQSQVSLKYSVTAVPTVVFVKGRVMRAMSIGGGS
ncbi:PREDICTED: glutaredoxin-3-like isoform X2 [Amphimedon queenslandica]|uniref:Thioredoxin domain-containing protein n=1 Tax=Amphimedon queenslandica TaxID=400682 RepID=A0AAN0J8L9_AMPQE|nr:PREDICTED: glutaredoxin-3-like isoform X2 [Amphimedon queenslandica]|eukprot:XP_019853053.1 PREDICTED: glutaredoxin-3-like isoform X2 [Amphimedon queenslandica]